MDRVKGKVAIVTGAAQGMGAAHARRLVEEGANVVLTDVVDKEGANMAASLGENAHYLHLDVTQESQWQQVIAETEKKFGPVTVLVNNAGIVAQGSIEEMKEEVYRRVIDVNQVGTFLGMKTVIPSMRRAGGGAIINISSIAGLIGAPHALPYTASKFAVRGMTKAAAIELAKYGIRVNSVHPGMVKTAMSEPVEPTEMSISSSKALLDATPAKRWGLPVEVANVIVFLASDESPFSTGGEFVVDGGLTCQ